MRRISGQLLMNQDTDKCQKKTLERTIIGGKKEEPRAAATPASSFSRTPVTASYSRSGRRVTQINFANQF